MKHMTWLLRMAVGAILLLPLAAYAGTQSIQYTHVTGQFAFTSSPYNDLHGEEKVTIQNSGGGSIFGFTGQYYLDVSTSSSSPHLISGSLTTGPSNTGSTLFDFSQGQLSIFTTSGHNAVFAVTVLQYSNVTPGLQSLIPNGAHGSFTGSTAGTWNGASGQFNGQFSANTPELGSSVAMATMLLGAGFLGFRRKR